MSLLFTISRIFLKTKYSQPDRITSLSCKNFFRASLIWIFLRQKGSCCFQIYARNLQRDGRGYFSEEVLIFYPKSILKIGRKQKFYAPQFFLCAPYFTKYFLLKTKQKYFFVFQFLPLKNVSAWKTIFLPHSPFF